MRVAAWGTFQPCVRLPPDIMIRAKDSRITSESSYRAHLLVGSLREYSTTTVRSTRYSSFILRIEEHRLRYMAIFSILRRYGVEKICYTYETELIPIKDNRVSSDFNRTPLRSPSTSINLHQYSYARVLASLLQQVLRIDFKAPPSLTSIDIIEIFNSTSISGPYRNETPVDYLFGHCRIGFHPCRLGTNSAQYCVRSPSAAE